MKLYKFEVQTLEVFNVMANSEEQAFNKLLDSEDISSRAVITCLNKDNQGVREDGK